MPFVKFGGLGRVGRRGLGPGNPIRKAAVTFVAGNDVIALRAQQAHDFLLTKSSPPTGARRLYPYITPEKVDISVYKGDNVYTMTRRAYPKSIYKPERIKAPPKHRGSQTIGCDWWDAPPDIDSKTGRKREYRPVMVMSHMCFSPMTCAGVRDTDPIVSQGLRSVTSLHDQSSVEYDKDREEQVCRSCKNPGDGYHTPHTNSSSHSV
jgi:hypothetical protein